MSLLDNDHYDLMLFQNHYSLLVSRDEIVVVFGEKSKVNTRIGIRDIFFLSTVLGTLSPKKNVPNTVSVLGTMSLITTVSVLGTLSPFQY